VEEFGARSPRDFLADIDFFVYYPRSGMVEAFGRTVMEAMASGAVAVLDPSLRPSFGDAAVYAEPDEAMAVVARLYQDAASYRRLSEYAQGWVRDHLGHERAVARVADLIGAARRPVPRPVAGLELPTVLFVSSNGAGMGHLTRLLAIARRSAEWCRPLFLSLSQAVPVVGREGFPFEYFPSRGALGMETGVWNPMFEARFRQALDQHRPAAVVFDGTWPYLGLVRARADYPETRFVWSRRGMWKADTPPDQLRKSQYFDLVIEPGEAAAAYDRGPTAQAADAARVAPVTYLDPSDLFDRERARHELGLRQDSTAVLVSLGAGNINDISSTVGAVTNALAERDDVEVVVTRSPIARRATALDSRLKTVSTFPLSRYFRAFDASVAAAGYNSFHETLAFGLPSVYVPNTATRTDDQLARARWAADEGVGWHLDDEIFGDIGRALGSMLDEQERLAVRGRMSRLSASDGAHAGATLLKELLA
jgi:UDP:flavonoid glycosyltransferase YjiC (YdhE family)